MRAIRRVERLLADWFTPSSGARWEIAPDAVLTVADLRALLVLAKSAAELKRQLTSRYPLFGNPWPNGVCVEWISGRGWVPIEAKPLRRSRGKR